MSVTLAFIIFFLRKKEITEQELLAQPIYPDAETYNSMLHIWLCQFEQNIVNFDPKELWQKLCLFTQYFLFYFLFKNLQGYI